MFRTDEEEAPKVLIFLDSDPYTKIKPSTGLSSQINCQEEMKNNYKNHDCVHSFIGVVFSYSDIKLLANWTETSNISNVHVVFCAIEVYDLFVIMIYDYQYR